MPRPFHFSHFTGIDGSILVTNDESRVATEQDLERHFWRQAEPELDRLTLEMCAHHRARGEALEPWQHDAEAGAMARIRPDGMIRLCESVRSAGLKLPPEYREQYGRALMRRELSREAAAT